MSQINWDGIGVQPCQGVLGTSCYCAFCCSSSVVRAIVVLCKHIYCSGPAADNADLQPQGLAPGTSGVLVHQVCIVCVRTRFPVPVQLLCSARWYILCAPVTPQIRNGNAHQRFNARSLTSSSRLHRLPQECRSRKCCSVALLCPWYLCAHRLPTTYRFIGEETDQREKHGHNTAHSLRRLFSFEFAAYSHCSSGRMCKSCAHRTAPHRTAPHRTFSQQHRLQHHQHQHRQALTV